ncbi:MAG: ABC transporter permease subunit [Clostridia bacterium]
MLINRDLIFPTPLATLNALIDLIIESSFLMGILFTLLRIVAGYSLGVVVGIALGILTAFYPFFNTLLRPMLGIIKSTPVSSFIILVLLWVTVGFVPVLISFLMVTPLIWSAVHEGIISTDPLLIEMADFFKVKRKKKLIDIYLPSIKPLLYSACTTALGFAWKSGVAAEVLSQPQFSLGKTLYESKIYLETDKLFAVTAVVIILSILLEFLLKKIMRKKGAIKNAVK